MITLETIRACISVEGYHRYHCRSDRALVVGRLITLYLFSFTIFPLQLFLKKLLEKR